MRTDGLEPIEVRDPRVPLRYLGLVGRGPDIKGVTDGSAITPLYPLTPSSRIHRGLKIYHPTYGDCVVERALYGPVWMLTCESDGGHFHDVVAGNNWSAYSPAG